MATTQVIDLLLQDGSDYESTVGIVGILYATVAAHAGAAYKRTPPQKTRARRLTGSLCAASTIRALGFAAFAILTPTRRDAQPPLRQKESSYYYACPTSSSCRPTLLVRLDRRLVRRRRRARVHYEVVGGLFFEATGWIRSINQYRWHFRVAYFGLNVVLVGAMVLLYALIFFSGIDGVRYTYVALALASA